MPEENQKLKNLSELAQPLQVTKNSVFKARERGEIGGVVPVGRRLKIRAAAYHYHRENGYGETVTPWAPEMST